MIPISWVGGQEMHKKAFNAEWGQAIAPTRRSASLWSFVL